ncbi:carbonic anhydrase [Arenibaculum pallidiluteum]|uniref:carbonic anhydrase n=1 Tax=Arenibaculum pallidiluteum TaxID=2812559 RepID=UPI001A965B60|nr:carbonic anhydrase [Arenibaculum pallidiluteum]
MRFSSHKSPAHPARRAFLWLAALGGASLAARPGVVLAASEKTDLTPDQALARLKEGNANFVTDAPYRAAQGRERRLEIARGQKPFAVLVGCSDSRVPPELLFGRGLGELFIVRVAGNTVDRAALGSIEYAVAELGVPLVVVLGHERCGAVMAAVEVYQKGTVLPGAIGEMVEPIIPAVVRARAQGGDLVEMAVKENARTTAARLRTEGPILAEAVGTGRLKIVAASYDLDDGRVDFLDGA